MPPSSPPDDAPIRPPHPLALRLIERLRARWSGRARVLDLAAGTGRNATALRAAGFDVLEIDDSAAGRAPMIGVHGDFAGMISTHGFLHGTAAEIARRLDACAGHLQPGAAIALTFGSVHDPRFGEGTRIEETTYAPLDGEERGVAHAFFTEAQVRALLEPAFDVESIEHHAGDKVHWFVLGRRR